MFVSLISTNHRRPKKFSIRKPPRRIESAYSSLSDIGNQLMRSGKHDHYHYAGD